MSGNRHKVVVTSPDHLWLGNSLEQADPPILAVLVGKNTPKSQESDRDPLIRVMEESKEMDIVALFFEKRGDIWTDVPVEKLGVSPYQVNAILAVNFCYAIRPCVDSIEQQKLLQHVGLAIDEQFVGC